MDNYTSVIGKLIEEPTFSHKSVSGEMFYKTKINIPRLSGIADVIPVIIPEHFMGNELLHKWATLNIVGQFRSISWVDGEKRKNKLFIFTKDIQPDVNNERSANCVRLRGTICKKPISRKTGFGKDVCDTVLAVNRKFGKSDYIPIILWRIQALEIADMNVGDKVEVQGRIQSREFMKKIDIDQLKTETTYEVSVKEFMVVRDEDED